MKAIFFLSVLLSSLAFGQNQLAPKHLRLMPLGQLPDWKEKLEDGKRMQIIPEGSVPPANIALPSGKKGGIQTTPLMLGVMSKTLRLDAKIPSLQFHEGKLAVGQPWLQAPVHKSTRTLGVLFEDPVEMTWEKPRILLLDDSQEAFPPGNIRFVNAGQNTALVKSGITSRAIKPGKFLMLPLKEGKNVLTIGYLDKASSKPVLINEEFEVRIMANQRIQAFFYQNQKKGADNQLLFKWLPEPPPVL